VPTRHGTEVLLLQHPLETGHAKGSARLLHLSLANSRLHVSEQFGEEQLRALLFAPFSPDAEPDVQPVLLYPDNAGTTTSGPHPTDSVGAYKDGRLRLVVLDATWRKSRKMLYLNPLLQSLPRLALDRAPPSRYAIRKAHKPGQLSTYEAVCYALMQFEADAERVRPLLAAFDGFVMQQQRQQQGLAGVQAQRGATATAAE